MGISERRKREKKELKKSILEKAKDILLKEGWQQLSIRNIATAIEYSPATIYLYFEGKDEIVYQLMEMGFLRMQEYFEPVYKETHPVERIRKSGLAFLDFALSNPEWFELLFNTPEHLCDIDKYVEDSSPGFRLFDGLLQACEEAIAQKYTHITDAKILAMILWSTVQGLVTLIRSGHLEHLIEREEQELIGQTMDTFMGTIFQVK
ncbi:MAG: TetR/AcrR family transcriptional regulator [Saprospiraceae bacterium]|nr:TetR/AcrR family transcriptional regulator [Saprospiraceae bacterium]MCB9324470.1 TetR/AcrR family transcriptional regulator [Lewinellaceae bacterium]